MIVACIHALLRWLQVCHSICLCLMSKFKVWHSQASCGVLHAPLSTLVTHTRAFQKVSSQQPIRDINQSTRVSAPLALLGHVVVVAFALFPTVPANTIAAGAYHTCVVTAATGGVRCWGYNGKGQCGIAPTLTTFRITTPPTVDLLTGVLAIAAAGSCTCVITSSTRGVRCWGDNSFGQVS